MEISVFLKSGSIFYMSDETELSILLHSELTRRNLSLRDAAKKIGISHPTLGSVLSGGKPSFEIAVKLASFLHVPTEKVLRASGLLPEFEIKSEFEEQLLFLVNQMTEDQKQRLLDYAKFQLM